MQALTALLFALAWWLVRKPILWWVRYRVMPEDLRARLNLDPHRPVCFVLPQRSWTDLFVLDRICADWRLPRPRRTGNQLPTIHRPGFVYLSVMLESRARGADVTGLMQRAVADPNFDIQLVPVSIFWGREPEHETSLWKLVFADSVQAGWVRKFFIVLFNGRNVLANFGQPVAFREFMKAEADPQRALRKLTRGIHFHFLRTRTATLGPSLVRRGVVIEGLLNAKGVRLAMEQEAKDKHQTLEQVRRRAQKMAEEICADYSVAAINFLERFLRFFVWNRVFKGIDVQGMERVRELAQSHVMIYLPSHRSHADYLLMSFVLYHAGLVPPHIAAGENLNMPVVGPLLRRCGAFFMRRKFQGDRLYSSLFRAYMDSLIRRGWSIEFFPEGGRSRTGRLLAPKTGLMAMMVESALRQRVRKVMVMPVHLGYDKVWEINSYLKELRGGPKQKESVQGLLKATRMLTKSYGKAYVNFGEPIPLEEFADGHLPGWRESITADAEGRPEGFNKLVTQLALETMRRVNSATVVTPTGLLATALLAAPQKAAAEADLREQVGVLIALLNRRVYGRWQYVPVPEAPAVLDWAEPIAGVSRIEHQWGDLIVAESRAAVQMTYARNNIVHLFALPSLIANFFRTRYSVSEEAVASGCRLLYPFLGWQFFLRWKMAEIESEARAWIEVMVGHGLLERTEQGLLRRPEFHSPAFARLVTLGRIMGETFERYCLSALLLSEERKLGPIERARFEDDCRLFAERMAVLTGRNAPEFFDAALFKAYVSTLIDLGLVRERPDQTLEVHEGIERIAERSMELLGGEAQQTVLQILARKPVTAPAEAPPAATPPPAANNGERQPGPNISHG